MVKMHTVNPLQFSVAVSSLPLHLK